MKKLATATAAAIVGLAFAVPASAEVSLSGSLKQDFGFGSYAGGADSEGNVHMETDAEVHFKASGTTDGGVGVSVKIELEAQPNTQQVPPGAPDGKSIAGHIDEAAITFSGGFGSVTIGNEDPAALSHGYVGIGGGYAGMGYYDGGDTWTPVGSSAWPFGAYDDAQKVIYSFPAMGGLSLGVSFAPDTNGRHQETSATNGNGQVSVGASYSADLGGTSVSIGGGMISSTENDENADGTDAGKTKGKSGAGVSIGFADTTIHLRMDRDSDDSGSSGAQRGLGFGIDHSLGALSIGLGYSAHTKEPGGVEQSDTLLVAGVSYDLGGGVAISAAVARGTDEDRVTTADDPATATVDETVIDDTSGVGLGIRLAFGF